MDSAKRFDPMLLEAALYHPSNACKAQSDHEEQGLKTLTKSDGNGRIIEEQQEGPDTGSPSQTPAGESDEGADTKGSGAEKKRKKRAKNWGDEETMILLKAVSQKKKTKSRFNQGCDTELSYWDSIAKKVRDRTGDECRRRMETLIKSYKAIERYCDQKKKEFTELTAEDFEVMKPKLATRITESWYNYIRDQCAPRSGKKMMRDQGVGSPFANGAPVVCATTSGGVGSLPAGFQNPVAESMQLVIGTTPVSAIQSKPALEGFGVEHLSFLSPFGMVYPSNTAERNQDYLLATSRRIIDRRFQAKETWSWACGVDQIQVWIQLVTISNRRLRKCRE
ncbi:hypothetical protein M758_6G187700 [Ceratodon purpureus]|nr:hypothetical protein M758_6G187700 [Ceratodon purpureus]